MVLPSSPQEVAAETKELEDLLRKALIKGIKAGDFKASFLAQAIRWLKDHEIPATTRESLFRAAHGAPPVADPLATPFPNPDIPFPVKE